MEPFQQSKKKKKVTLEEDLVTAQDVTEKRNICEVSPEKKKNKKKKKERYVPAEENIDATRICEDGSKEKVKKKKKNKKLTQKDSSDSIQRDVLNDPNNEDCEPKDKLKKKKKKEKLAQEEAFDSIQDNAVINDLKDEDCTPKEKVKKKKKKEKLAQVGSSDSIQGNAFSNPSNEDCESKEKVKKKKKKEKLAPEESSDLIQGNAFNNLSNEDCESKEKVKKKKKKEGINVECAILAKNSEQDEPVSVAVETDKIGCEPGENSSKRKRKYKSSDEPKTETSKIIEDEKTTENIEKTKNSETVPPKKKKKRRKMEALPIPSKGALEVMLVSNSEQNNNILDGSVGPVEMSVLSSGIDGNNDKEQVCVKPVVKPLKKKRKLVGPVITNPEIQKHLDDKEKGDEANVNSAITSKGLYYLDLWKNDRENWTFKKNCQVWLIKNLYNEEIVDDVHFEALLQYLDGLKGGARERLLGSAKTKFNDKNCDVSTKERSRQIIQCIS